jgi:hypothetical protein
MYKNYLLVAFRNFARNKAFSLINVVGLALGMACSLLIFLWVNDERGMDRLDGDSSRLYAVYERVFSEGTLQTGYATPGLLGSELIRKVPEIRYASAFDKRPVDGLFSAGDKNISLPGAFADSDFFKIFKYPLLEGTAASALSGPDHMAVSRKMAVSFFGNPAAAIGKTLRYNNSEDFKVTAVFDDLPANSSRKFEYLLNWPFMLREVTWLNIWIYREPLTFVELQPNADPVKVQAKIRDFVSAYLTQQNGAGYHLELGLQPYDEMYLHSTFRDGRPAGGRIEYVRLFSWVAVFVLFIGCINFMNLSTARSLRRAKEVGIRKAVGALRTRLIVQFMGEALLLSFLSALVALLLSALALPWFDILTGKQLTLPLSSIVCWIYWLGLTGITGVIAGSYPALFLSSFNPVKVLKGAVTFSPAAVWFRKGLVVFQFVLSIGLIVATLVVARQMRYVQRKNLGYDKENLIYIPFKGDLAGKYQVFRQQLTGQPGIAAVTRSTQAPSHINTHVYDLDWEGKRPDARVVAIHSGVGYGYLDMLHLSLLEGRDFSRDFPTDSLGYIINETALKMMGFQHGVGRWLNFFGRRGHIIGVVKDFHLKSLHEPIEPLVLYLADNTDWGFTMVKTTPGGARSALASLEKAYHQLEPKFEFTYFFADEEYQKLYASEQTLVRLSDGFSALAILISCLGLLGLAIFTAEQRTREIGIRKVIGAGVGDIVWMLLKDVVRLVMIAAVIASPLAWVAMNNWLQDYAYRIRLDWWIFLVAGLLAGGIALVTVGYQAVKAAMASPVRSLRSE